MKKSDFIIAIFILIIAGTFLGINKYRSNFIKQNSSQLYAEIYVEGKLYKKVPILKNEQVIEIENEHGKNMIKIHDNGVEMIDADCLDKICVQTGFKKEVSETIVCLPHQVVVEIKGNMEGKVDAISN
ncbi:NusG domain II-containing protein [Clostridium ganghwense]|uniref:NusG domain II-containing protein n=1 Tax=Clostridium ganghwense TaxID=312089 RepID=A0ABT4CUT0_9CLOT|nr:NusG domain II-containing protein [Clostridium ganghwense]MCY6372663.1 NusG domain II-containing protein [Clostridium ganghwense]